MDDILGEFIRAETRFLTQAQLDGQSAGSAFTTSKPRPRFVPQSAKSGSSSSGGPIKCHFCHEIGHPQSLSRKRNICSYCKKDGHIIVDCRAPGRKNFVNARSSTSYATQGLVATESQAETNSAPPSKGSSTDISQLVHNELAAPSSSSHLGLFFFGDNRY
ncbi:hypothetical protein LINPERPRIM_LOCUS22438 [Linum perenne]